MRHLAYALKVMINDDLKAQDRPKVHRAPRRSEAVSATAIEPLVQSAPRLATAVRSPEVARPRRTANVGT
jgi:hypothetical protein